MSNEILFANYHFLDLTTAHLANGENKTPCIFAEGCKNVYEWPDIACDQLCRALSAIIIDTCTI
jgi:hypothetical protein